MSSVTSSKPGYQGQERHPGPSKPRSPCTSSTTTSIRAPISDSGRCRSGPTMPRVRNWREGGYIKRISNDPWGNPYQYVFPGTRGQEYDLYLFRRRRRGRRRRRECRHWQLESRSIASAARARARCGGLHAHRAHDRGVHHRPHHRGGRSSPSAASIATPNSSAKPSASTPSSTTCASRPNCRPATTAFASTTSATPSWCSTCCGMSGAPLTKTTRCANAHFPKGSSRRSWSMAAASCSIRKSATSRISNRRS